MELLQVERDGTVLRAELYGPTDVTLVAFTHGGWMDRHMFAAQVGPVVAAGYRVLVWDLRGHGESGPRGIAQPRVADLAADLEALLAASRSPTRAVLVGQSLGGMVAQHVALTDPARVAGVVAVGAPLINPSDRRTARRMAAVWRVSGWVTAVLPRSVVTRMMASGVATEPEVQRYVHATVGRRARAELAWVARAPLGAGAGIEGRAIEVPVLVVRGDRDGSGAGRLAAATAREWVRRDPAARYVEIQGAGHQTNQDQPERFNRLLLDYLSRLDVDRTEPTT